MKHTVVLKNGIEVPALGLGTWYLGENERTYEAEKEALLAGIDAGMTLIDTAEMYGNGLSEELVGDVIAERDRSSLYLVSKVLPHHASKRDMKYALEDSLERLGTDYLDLYLYHWRGGTPLAETVEGLEELKTEGKIREWGVSNFDIDDMEELFSVKNGSNCLVNQVLYHVGSRGIEYSLLPWMKEHNVTLMAYCPLAQGGSLKRSLLRSEVLQNIAEKHDCTVLQVMLAWSFRDGHTISIPRSSKKDHVLQNAAADEIELDAEDLAKIDDAFHPPVRKEYLDIQ